MRLINHFIGLPTNYTSSLAFYIVIDSFKQYFYLHFLTYQWLFHNLQTEHVLIAFANLVISNSKL